MNLKSRKADNRAVSLDKLKQGAVAQIDFDGCKNISDRLDLYNVNPPSGCSRLTARNFMNEDTYFYVSQGDGVRALALPARTSATIPIRPNLGYEMLIGSPYCLYECPATICCSTIEFSILLVTKKLDEDEIAMLSADSF